MFAPEGRLFVVGAAVLTVGAAVLQLWSLALVLALATAFLANFFRDPERTPASASPTDVISPADGRVVVAAELPPTGRPIAAADLPVTLSIFMNVFDVHVNRSPLDGTIASVQRAGGLKLPADDRRAPLENERVEIRLDSPAGPLLFVQVAGLVARRIVFRRAVGERIARGERVGIIKFGSRVDVYLPPGSELLVREGDRCRAGETPIARMPAAK